MDIKYFLTGLAFWASIIFLLWTLRPSSSIHVEISAINLRGGIISAVVVIILIAASTLPMAWNPNWTGELYPHHNQYQLLADAFLKGQLYLDVPIDSRLLSMKNPYDPQAREALDLNEGFGWDSAFYNGKFYVYFGALPALVIFAPYQFIFDEQLAAYRAAQIFVAIFIVGLFALLYLLAKKFFPRMSFGVYLISAVAFSMVSVSYCTAAPALYCTAIAAGLCVEVWSVCLLIRAAYFSDKFFLAEIFFGGLLGALAFACKPTVALANFLILPLLPLLIKKSSSLKVLPVLIAPYLVTCAALMIYNFLRFDNFFEFGQAYQLTVADQHTYGKFAERFNLSAQIDGLTENFFAVMRYAIFWLPIFLPKYFAALREKKIIGVVLALCVTPILITAVQIHWTPFLLERYRLEIYWLLALLSFVAIGFLTENKKFNFVVCVPGVATIFQCLNLFFTPNDFNFAAIYPDLRPTLLKVLTLGF